MKLSVILSFTLFFLMLATSCSLHPVTQTTSSSLGSSSSSIQAGEVLITEVGTLYYFNDSSWFEIYNAGSNTINLASLTLRCSAQLDHSPWTAYSETNFTLPNLNIPPQGYVIIRGKTSDKHIDGTDIVYLDQNNLFPLWYQNGFIELLYNGNTIDFVRFGSDTTSPSTGNWSGTLSALPATTNDYTKSLARSVSNTDTDSASDWILRDFFTPGGPNDITNGTDSDGDGIPDQAESVGGTWAGLPLYDWGARVGPKDVFIYISYMDSSDLGITPRKEALQKILPVFSNHNIQLHFDVGNLYHPSAGISPSDFDLSDTDHKVGFAAGMDLGESVGLTNFYDYKNHYLSANRRHIMHYCIFANSQNADGSEGSSGLAELDGNDLMITLGGWNLSTNTPASLNTLINWQAAVLMHEFGHNLGLHHGGNNSTNYSPNYISVMNYLYSLYGMPNIGGGHEGDRYYYEYNKLGYTSYQQLENGPTNTDMILDFSDGSGANLDENSASESAGLLRSASLSVDWNGDGDASDTTSIDLNNDGVRTVLHDYNDWANLHLFFNRENSGFNSGPGLTAASPFQPIIYRDPDVDDRQHLARETLIRPE